MMASPTSCPLCFSSEIEEDDSRAEVYLVCTSCGYIIEDRNLSFDTKTTYIAGGTSYVAPDGSVPGALNPVKKFRPPNIPPAKKQGFLKITQLSSAFNLSNGARDNAKKLFCYAYAERFLKAKAVKKIILAAACVYVIMRQCEIHITPEDICKYLDCKKNQFFAIYKQLEDLKGYKVAPEPIGDLVRLTLSGADLDKKEHVIRKTVKILEVCYKCWLVTGQSRKHNIIAASYIAWVSSDLNRRKVKFASFFDQLYLPKEMMKTSSMRLRDMASLFIKHADKLPWRADTPHIVMDRKTYFSEVDNVLDYFECLHKTATLEDSETPDIDPDILDYKNFRPKSSTRKKPNRESEGQSSAVPDSNYDEEICDEELDQYIRPKEEVAEYLKFLSSIGEKT